MFRRALIAIALCLAAGAQAETPPMLVRYESPVETTTLLTSLPASVPTKIAVRGCQSCAEQFLNVTAATRFFIKKERVELADLRAAATGNLPLGVFYIEETSEVTRIVLYRDPPQRQQQRSR